MPLDATGNATLGGYDPTEPAANAGFSLIAVKSSA